MDSKRLIKKKILNYFSNYLSIPLCQVAKETIESQLKSVKIYGRDSCGILH